MTDRPTLSSLESAAPFARRHIGPDATEQAHMLAALGYDSMADLLYAAIPDTIRTSKPLDLPAPMSEVAVRDALASLAGRNHPLVPMIGLGYSGTVTPAVIRRNVLEDPSWYTAYTPYQPEISQGRLEALLNFQTMVSDLSGLAISNASLLDEATAAAEAMTLVRRANRNSTSRRFIVDADCLPQTIAVVQTRAAAMGLTVEVRDVYADVPTEDVSGVLLQYPGASGRLADPRLVIEATHAAGGLAVVAADLLALTLVESPGSLGADVVLGSSQRFGVPLFYGGPHAGFMAVSQPLARHLPGRLVGVSVDAEGRAAYRL
ncbi:MAG: glycine dehydrogenase, partial [Frankiaceae bacterium]|nr:glycine dehydrogenase [Frankiaceae bacterium]